MAKNKAREAGSRKQPSLPPRGVASLSPWEREVDRWLGDFRRRFSFPPVAGDDAWWPFAGSGAALGALDVIDEHGDVVVRAELPGVGKEDVEVTLTGSRLTIRAQKRKDEEIKEEHFYRSERRFGEIVRSVDVPPEVDPERISASFKDGVLEIRLPQTAGTSREPHKVRVD